MLRINFAHYDPTTIIISRHLWHRQLFITTSTIHCTKNGEKEKELKEICDLNVQKSNKRRNILHFFAIEIKARGVANCFWRRNVVCGYVKMNLVCGFRQKSVGRMDQITR